MQIFNARLDILQVSNISASEWIIQGRILDNTMTFFATDVNITDNIFAYSADGSNTLSRYKVDSIISAGGLDITMTVSWNEPDVNYADPGAGYDAIIGRRLAGGTTSITSITNGVGYDIVSTARNIDTMLVSFSTDVVDGGIIS